MSLAPKVGIRAAANFIIILSIVIGVIVGLVVAVGALGKFLLPIALVVCFLILMSAVGPSNVPAWVLVAGIPLTFLFGYASQTFLSSIVGYDPIQVGYTTGMAAIKLDVVGYTMDDSTWNFLLGAIVLIALVIFAMLGMFVKMRRGKR